MDCYEFLGKSVSKFLSAQVIIEQEAEQLKQDKENIDGHDTAVDMVDKLKEAQSQNESKVARLSGRRSEIIEQIRSVSFSSFVGR